MTTEPPAKSEPTDGPEPDASQPTPRPSGIGRMANMSGEPMVVIGAGLVLASFVLFQLLSGDFFQYVLVLVAATFAVIMPQINKETVSKLASPALLMKMLGYVIAVTGGFEILYDLRFGVLDDGMEIMAALVAYAGYVIAFLGARSIRT